jgi:hypothetical protein
MNSPTSTALIALSLIAGAAGAQSTQPVEWKVSEGGNGHWYQAVSQALTWSQARQQAQAMGGYLATITSAAENAFIVSIGNVCNYWLGGFQPSESYEPNGNWQWVTGEPWLGRWGEQLGYSNWETSQPDNAFNSEHVLAFHDVPYYNSVRWNDKEDRIPRPGFVIEWAGDCNDDGKVDFGQIRAGELADSNGNNVPDVCELSVSGVLPVSGPSEGGTVIAITGNNFPSSVAVSIGGVAAINVNRISATRIIATTPRHLPGVADVTVSGWTSQNAFYYRPECGSDLDQDGEVTAADIAIVLLDFGPCYVTATSPQAEDSKPFMLQEQPAPEAPQSR